MSEIRLFQNGTQHLRKGLILICGVNLLKQLTPIQGKVVFSFVIMSTPLGGGYIIFAFCAVRRPMSGV